MATKPPTRLDLIMVTSHGRHGRHGTPGSAPCDMSTHRPAAVGASVEARSSCLANVDLPSGAICQEVDPPSERSQNVQKDVLRCPYGSYGSGMIWLYSDDSDCTSYFDQVGDPSHMLSSPDCRKRHQEVRPQKHPICVTSHL